MSGTAPTRPAGRSLQRRVLLYVLLCAPVVWALALVVSAHRARLEVNELYDSEMIRLTRQVQATLGSVGRAAAPAGPAAPMPAPDGAQGDAELSDFVIAAWAAGGQPLRLDAEGTVLPWRADAAGFHDMTIDGNGWRAYYLQSPHGEWLVAAGQRTEERDELVLNLVAGQLLPWLAVLPVLLAAMAWAVRQAMAPLRALATDLHGRSADDLRRLSAEGAPAELQPLLAAMNGLFSRIDEALVRERRFTADAAHELRTPLAVLRAQWDVLRSTSDPAVRREAEARLAIGFDRMDRLVTQMLSLARLEATDRLADAQPIDWAELARQAFDDVLALADRRRIELACEWPPGEVPPWPLRGDAGLMAVLLRNLLDNAARYAPGGSTVTLAIGAESISVANDGPALDAATLARIGERFHRDDGQRERGSGLGVSIARRVAELHGLSLSFSAGPQRRGVVARLAPASGRAGPAVSAP